ncbi:MAG: SPOR domain-containing protein [Pseudomonadota bacterium]
MDIALKQRLVGATVIVCLAVIFIPMLLDGPAEGGRSEVELSIPEPPDGRYETRRLPLNPSLTPPDSDMPLPDAEPEPSLTSVPEVVVDTTPPRTTLRDPPPAQAPAPAMVAEEPAPAASTDRDVPEPTTVAAGGGPGRGEGQWFLQLGSFSRVANANSLIERLSAGGINAWSDPIQVDGRTLHRVRAGDYRTRDAAMAGAARISELIRGAGELSLRQRVEQASGADSIEPAGNFGWWVQAGVFSSETNAVALRDRLRAAGLVASVDRIDAGQGARFRVRVGPELERADADAVRARLRNEFEINALVVGNS